MLGCGGKILSTINDSSDWRFLKKGEGVLVTGSWNLCVMESQQSRVKCHMTIRGMNTFIMKTLPLPFGS